ncbi:MAG: DUF4397 domain-containing protein [Bacteroidia bacterium]|jgi:hypothetical protein|nr:DUF4397 domain-containing protein [Bacteroidia bacterium]GIV23654.1 MAG: hypothetical protein KatS3mg025_1313 [Bacteroidia bacterium]
MAAARKLLLVGLLALGWAQNAYVQLIHAVADVVGVSFPYVLDSVDIYLSTDGGTTWTLAVPDFKFRQATPYTPVPANSTSNIAGVAPGNSTGPGDILLQYTLPTLAPGSYNVAMIAGTINFFSGTADVSIYYYQNARNIPQNPSYFEFILFHGAADVGTVGAYLAWDRPLAASAYQPDVTLPQYAYSSSYLGIAPDNFLVLDTNTANPNDIFPIGFAIPSGYVGQAGVIFASGYVNTPDPQKAFALHLALGNGTVIPLGSREVRRIQLLHNAADPALAQVDIHLGSVGANPIQLDFRQATPTFFVDGPAGSPVTLVFTGRGQSTPLATTNLSLPPAGTNAAVIAEGVLNPTAFAANPNNIPTDFGLVAFTGVEGWAPSGSFKVIPFHGVTDAPAVDLYSGSTSLATNLRYKDRGSLLTLPANTAATIEVRPAGQSTALVTYTLSAAQARDGEGSIVFASGFLNPSANQNGPAFGLYVVYPDGEVQPLSTATTTLAKLNQPFVQLSENPSPGGEWALTVSAATAGTLPYEVSTLSGQIVRQGEWTLPGPGTWGYTLALPELPSGVYLLQVGSQTFRLVRF